MRKIRTFAGRSVLTVTLVVAGLAMGLQPAAATPVYGLRNQLYVQAEGGTSQQTFFNDTGSIASNVPLTQSFTAYGKYPDPGFGTAEGYATGAATVFYGSLEASGSGFDSPVWNRDGAGAEVVPVIGAAPLVSYKDQLVVATHTLGVGTPVTLSFVFSFDGTSSFAIEEGGLYPAFADAEIATEFTMWDQTSGALHSFNRRIVSAGTYLETVTVAVGDVLDITGALLAQGQSFGGSGSSSFSFSDPTTEFIDVGTPDAFLVSASGHDYSSPRVVGVPEPDTLGLFGFGTALIGWCLIRRRSTAIEGADAA